MGQQSVRTTQGTSALAAALGAPAFSGIRVRGGRTLAWQEFGNSRGIPCLLLPDSGSSRMAPRWLLHDSALPDGVRLISLDRPGTGDSDTPLPSDRSTFADDLIPLIRTLAVRRVVVIGVGDGANTALALADQYPALVSAVMAVDVRSMAPPEPESRWRALFFGRKPQQWTGLLAAWSRAVGQDIRNPHAWERALGRMDQHAAELLGDRWRDEDFRDAVADDLDHAGPTAQPATAGEPPQWLTHWNSSVPVHFWHSDSTATPELAQLQELAARRRNWVVTAVPSSQTMLGSWGSILSAAQQEYLSSAVRF